MSLGFTEILLIFIAILLLFGAKRIPELVKSIAKAQHEYKKAKELIKKETDEIANADSAKAEPETKQQPIDVTVEEKNDK